MDSKEVFISYSSKQAEIAFAVCEYLEKHDIKCWIAPRDIPSGSNYTMEIPNGLGQCKVMVLVFSETATQSQWITLEVMSAVNNNMTIIPFRVEEYPVTSNMSLYFMLQKSQWIDAYPNFEDHLEILKRDIEKIIGKKSLNLNPTDPIEQFQLGMNYYSGVYVQNDLLLARKWFTLAAKQGHVKSMKMLGDVYSALGKESMSKIYYTKAADNGDAQSQYILGNKHYKKGHLSEAIELFERSVENGSFEALDALADMFYYGKGVCADYDRAYIYCEQAILTESAKAYYLLGRMNFYGEGREIDYSMASRFLEKARAKGVQAANFELGISYEHGLGVDKDLNKAIQYFIEAHTGASYMEISNIRDTYKNQFLTYGVNQGYNETTQYYYTAGLLFEEEKDILSATAMYEIAAARGSVDAIARYGVILCEMNDFGRGLPWLEKASEQHSAKALTYLGNCYLEGWGYEKNRLKAFDLYQKAHNLGDIMGSFYLALFHINQTIKEGEPLKGIEILQSMQNFCSQDVDGHNDGIKAVFYGRNYYRIDQFLSPYDSRDHQPFKLVTKTKECLGENQVTLDQEISMILGYCYHYGLGVKRDHLKAIYYLENVHHGYNNYAEIDLGDIYSEGGFGIELDLTSAARNFEFSSYSSPFVQGYLDEAKNNGMEVDENYPPRAHFEIGWRFIGGYGARQVMPKAMEQLEIASKAGYVPASALLCNLHATGILNEVNPDKVNEYYSKAIANGCDIVDKFVKAGHSDTTLEKEIAYNKNLLSIFIDAFGEDDYHANLICKRLVYLTCQYEDYDGAQLYAYKSLKRQQRIHGLNTIECAEAYSLMANVFSVMVEYEKELDNRLKALEILKNQEQDCRRQIIDEDRKISLCLLEMEEYDKAEVFASKALNLSRLTYGEKHPNTVRSMDVLASVKKSIEKYEEAIDLYTRVLEIYISEIGEDSEPTANAYHNLGDAYWDYGNLGEAIRFEKKALEIYQKVDGIESRACEELYERIGILCYNSNDYDEAISYISKAYKIVKDAENQIGKGYYLHKLGVIYAAKGDIDSAIKIFQEALSLLPEDHPDAMDAREWLAELEK